MTTPTATTDATPYTHLVDALRTVLQASPVDDGRKVLALCDLAAQADVHEAEWFMVRTRHTDTTRIAVPATWRTLPEVQA